MSSYQDVTAATNYLDSARKYQPEPAISIRRYQPSDRSAVQKTCCDTGYLGARIDTIFHDRKAFAGLLVDPYLDWSPEWTFLAIADGRIVGYSLGATDVRFFRKHAMACMDVTQRIASQILAGEYREHRRSRGFVRWLLTRAALERVRQPPFATHMHLSVEKSPYGQAAGNMLWRAFEAQLTETKQNRYFCEVISCTPFSLERLFAARGFAIYDITKTSIFVPENRDVWSICFTKDHRFHSFRDFQF